MSSNNGVLKEDQKQKRKEILIGSLIGVASSVFVYYIVTWFYSAIFMIVRGDNIDAADRGMIFELPHLLYVILIASMFSGLLIYTLNNLGIRDTKKKYAYILYFMFLIVRLIIGVI